MDPLSTSASIIAVLQLGGTVAQYLNSVHNAPKERDAMLKEISSIVGVLFLMKHTVERTKEETSLGSVQFLAAPGGLLEQFQKILERLASKLSPAGSTLKKIGRVLHWPFAKDEIMGLLDSIERIKTRFLVALQADHLSTSLESKASIEKLGKDVEAIRITQDDEIDQRMLDWLSSINVAQKQQDIFDQHQEDTGSWFLESPKFVEWTGDNTSSSFLFCPGDPGTGKTVMFSLVVDHLMANFQTQNVAVAFAFCRYNEPDTKSGASIIASLARQLAVRNGTVHPKLSDLYHKLTKDKKRMSPSTKDLHSLLLQLAPTFDRVFLLVDGLDECDKKDRATLLSVLKDLSSLPQCKARIMVTARPHAQDINLAFHSSTRLEIKAQEIDVENYIRSQLENNLEILELMAESEEPDLKEIVVSSITSGASGLFLIAVLQLERICASDSVKEIRDTLTSMPNALTEMYAQSLERIAKQPALRCERGWRILAWIFKAYRPLSVDELLHALVVEECDKLPRQLDRSALVQPKVLLDVCAGLVTIEPISNTIRFIHATTHEFLSALENEYVTSADRHILKACVNYMSFEAFAKGPSASDEDLNLRLREYPFLTYSTQFWGRHLAKAEDGDLEKTTLEVLGSEEVMMAVNQVAHLSNFKFPGYSQLFPKQVTPLHLASSFGLLGMVVLFGADHPQKDFDSPDSFGWTALHRAAENGHEQIVKFLMERDCNVNTTATFGGTALHRAAKNGHARIATLLLGSERILIDVQDNYGGTALHRAAREGHEAVAQLLLSNGADVNKKYSFITALTMLKKNGFIDANATSRGYQYVDVWRSQDEAMARNEAEITASERLLGGTALHEAAGSGDEGVVQLLLRSGAMVNALDNFGASPLHRAAYNGHTDTMKILRQNGARLDHGFYHGVVTREMIEKEAYREQHRQWKAKDWVFRNMLAGPPLCQAAKNGQEPAVRLLLSYDPNPNAAGPFGGSALHQAAQSGHTEIVKLLLENGADVDTADESSTTHYGGTALHSAAAGGHLEVIRTLLKAGANVNRYRGIGASHATPLYLAAKGGYKSVCSLLLGHGAEIDSGVDYYGITPLEEAAKQGNINLIQLLLDHGAEKTDDVAGQAAAKRQLQVVKTLLQNGADPNRKMRYPALATRNDVVMKSCSYETILGAAISSADIETVDLLLSEGADPNMAWPEGKRPLLLAISLLKEAKDDIKDDNWNAKEADLQAAYHKKDQEFEAIVQLLLQKGADATAQDFQGNTPLHFAGRRGFDRLVALLLAGGANVNCLNSDRVSPLFAAAVEAHLPTLQLLLDAGARVEDGVSPLYEVTSEDAAQLLLRHSAEIQELDAKRPEALIVAASKGVESVVKILLERGEQLETTDDRGQNALYRAIKNNQPEVVRALLDHGADVESKPGRRETTPLLAAADRFRGSEASALLLVERGADINVKDSLYNRSVLGMAASGGMETLVRTLLDRGLPIDYADSDGCTPLNQAASSGHDGVVQILLQNGAKVDFTGNDSDFAEDSYHGRSRSTPLCAAVQWGHISTVRLLANAGAAIIGSTPDEYRDPLVCAASSRHLDALKALLDIYAERKSCRATVNSDQSEPQHHGSAQQAEGTTVPDDARLAASLSAALYQAVEWEDLETVRFLLQKGIKPSKDLKSAKVSWHHRRSSHYARMGVAIYSALLDAGAAFDFEGIFHIALDKAELALAQRLLPKLRPFILPDPQPATSSSDAAELDYEGLSPGLDGTPLSHAAEAGYEELVQQLLDAGFNPNTTVYGVTKTCTALTLAAENGHVAIVELLWRGEAKTKFLADPTQFLLGSEYEHICALVAQDLPDPNFASEDDERLLHRAAAHGHARAVKILLSRGSDPRFATASTLKTPLHYAVRSRNPAILQLLFEHGAEPDIEARDALRRTPLSYAAEGGCDAVAKFLLQHSAKTDTYSTNNSDPPDHQNKNSFWDRSPLQRQAVHEKPNPGGFAPLHYAASCGNAATATLLLSYSAAVDARDAAGRTALMLAAADGARGVALLLLEHGADPVAADEKGRTPLHHAAVGGWRGNVQLLLATGKIDPGARDGEGRTALHHAARVGSTGVVRMLLREGMGAGTSTGTGLGRRLDPNARDDARGWTALREALEERHEEVARVLVQCPEVDPAVEDAEGETALVVARKGWDRAIVDMLERRMGVEIVGST